MQMKFLWAGAAAMMGWVLYYMFARQLIFNFTTAYPLVKKMKAARQDLIADSADKYTTTSVAAIIFILAVLIFVLVRFFALYIIIAFFVGFAVCGIMLIKNIGPENRKIFDTFCGAYYRFVPDDELRTDMYNCKPSKMKVRLHEMGVSTDWIPDFKD